MLDVASTFTRSEIGLGLKNEISETAGSAGSVRTSAVKAALAFQFAASPRIALLHDVTWDARIWVVAQSISRVLERHHVTQLYLGDGQREIHHVLLLEYAYLLQTLVKHHQVQHTSWRTAFPFGCLAGAVDLFQIVVGTAKVGTVAVPRNGDMEVSEWPPYCKGWNWRFFSGGALQINAQNPRF